MAKLLDLFCGAGGAAMGYQRAGFDVFGVDKEAQRHYPFPFIQADALQYLAAHGHEFDAIHASPPCQAHSVLKTMWNARKDHEDFLPQTRQGLRDTGKPYVIENVVGAKMDVTLILCGSMFDLETPCGAQLRRHRLFESNVMLMSPGACRHGVRTVGVNGHEFGNEATRWKERRTIGVHGAVPRDPRLEKLKYRTISVVGHGSPGMSSKKHNRTITVTGNCPQQNVERNKIRETFSVDDARAAMGIDWMVMSELSQAIPPAYSHWIGSQIITYLEQKDAKDTAKDTKAITCKSKIYGKTESFSGNQCNIKSF